MMRDKWEGCYNDNWIGDIVPEAFSHPAKFSRGLIHRIYQHAKEMGWAKPGDIVLDPFGGVALGGLDAMSMGLQWIGIELEEKFVKLGEQNIELWNRQLRGWHNLGTARIVQGDSRRLRDVIEKADLVVSSPPFTSSDNRGGTKMSKGYFEKVGGIGTQDDSGYIAPGNLANMKEGDIDLVISSPPFMGVDCKKTFKTEIDKQRFHEGLRLSLPGRSDKALDKLLNKWSGLSDTPGNLANMKEGDIDCVISSPPFSSMLAKEKSDFTKGRERGRYSNKSVRLDYGTSPGQLGSMKEGSVDAVISSPPFEGVTPTAGDPNYAWKFHGDQKYGNTKDNLGNQSGDTFWSASKEIVQGCYDLLKPNGHAIWVLKDYIKAGKRVPFSKNWASLCESVGFEIVCWHQASLVKEHGVQITLDNEEESIVTERKSFFRRLAEKKGSPRIDWEDIICMKKGG